MNQVSPDESKPVPTPHNGTLTGAAGVIAVLLLVVAAFVAWTLSDARDDPDTTVDDRSPYITQSPGHIQ